MIFRSQKFSILRNMCFWWSKKGKKNFFYYAFYIDWNLVLNEEWFLRKFKICPWNLGDIDTFVPKDISQYSLTFKIAPHLDHHDYGLDQCHQVVMHPSSKYSAIHTALLDSACYWPCRNPCVFDVELATQSLSLFLTNQININLVHLKKSVKLYPFLCIHITHSAWMRWLRPRYRHIIVNKYFVRILLAVKFVQELRFL
jgi:hypothetical protein